MTTEKKTAKKVRAKPRGKRPVLDMPGLDPIAIELKRARLRKDLSHTQLSARTGISRTVLFGYEAGRTKPGTREIRRLAQALETNPNRLLFGTDEPFKSRTGLHALLKLRLQPGVLVSVLMLFGPMILTLLDDEELEAGITLLASLLEARDRKFYIQFATMAEVFVEQFLNVSTSEELAAMRERMNDPVFQQQMQDEITKRLTASEAKQDPPPKKTAY